MSDKLGNDVIKLQKEIMDISNKINLVRTKTHRSMSSILNGLKSLSKEKSQNHKNSNKNKKRIDEKNYFISNYDESFKPNNNIIRKNINNLNYCKHKKKIYKNLFKKNNGILNDFENNNKNKNDIYSKDYLFLSNIRNKKVNNRHIKYEINYRINELDNNILSDNNYTFNDNRISKRKKEFSKTDSLKNLYNLNPNSRNKNKENLGHYSYVRNIDYNNYYYKGDLINHKDYMNKLLNNNININSPNNRKSRNKSENIFKNREIETQKNDELCLENKNIPNDKASKTFLSEYFQKYNNINSNKENNSFYKLQKNILHKTYTYSNINQKNNKNIFREKASKGINLKGNIHQKKLEFYTNENNNTIDYYFKLLNAKNHEEYINKINKLKSYEDFIHKIQKLYYQYNDQNKDIKLKDILYWISLNIKKNNKINKYEELCHEIMRNYNIPNYDKFKIFFGNLINKNKKNDYFVNEMKELFNNFSEFQPNKTFYKNRNNYNNNYPNFTNKNEDDI